jgi:hypothetical protein
MPEETTSEEPTELTEKETALREGNISLILDGYDDIFSDFDPRPYGEKALSDDFLSECRRAVRDKDEHNLELRLLVPHLKRDLGSEATIKHRLKSHFTKHYHEKEQELKRIRAGGVPWFVVGMLCMLVAAYLYGLGGSGFGYQVLLIAFEPAGWFAFWVGLEQIFFGAKEKQPEHEFYRKMAHVEIEFFSY